MDESRLMRIMQTQRGLSCELARLLPGQTLGTQQDLQETRTFDELHHHVVMATGIADIESAGDIRMIHRQSRTRFLLKTG